MTFIKRFCFFFSPQNGFLGALLGFRFDFRNHTPFRKHSLHIWTSYPSSAPSINRLLFCEDAYLRVQMFVCVCVCCSFQMCVVCPTAYCFHVNRQPPFNLGPEKEGKVATYSHVVVNVVKVTHSNLWLFLLLIQLCFLIFSLSFCLPLTLSLSFLSLSFLCPGWITCPRKVHHLNHAGKFSLHLLVPGRRTCKHAVSSSLKICLSSDDSTLGPCGPLNKFWMCGFVCDILMDRRVPAPPPP